jgi:molybdopterin-containing oxidoreductase family iron-sulfur binding subunit
MKTTRRKFLGAAAGILGAGLLEGCTKKLPRYLVPHANPPDDVMPGLARHYRTVCRECPAGCGATARVREGHAVKLEGSPDDPIGRGALCPRGQSAIEGLYAPDRLVSPLSAGRELSWEAAEKALTEGIQRALEGGKRVVVLTRPERGQLGAFFGAWLTALGQPASNLVSFDAMDRPWLRQGQRRAFDVEAVPVHDLAAARLVLSLGDDFAEEGSPVEHARQLAAPRAAGGRLVYVGPRLSITAASADEWISVEPGSELTLVLGLLRQVLEQGGASAGLDPEMAAALRARLAPYDAAAVAARTGIPAATVAGLARALLAARPSLCLGPGRAVAGADADAVAEAVCVLNAVLGNLGQTVRYLAAPAAAPGLELGELIRLANAGEVGALLVHHADPLGYGPLHADFSGALGRIPFVAAFVNQTDETARRAHLVLADHHFLEAWSDVPVRPGHTAIQQPVMEAAFGTRAAADELLVVARALGKTTGLPEGTFGEAVRAAFDEKEIERGLKPTTTATLTPRLTPGALSSLPPAAAPRGPAGGLALVVTPSFRHMDGRQTRSALLQEIPDPLSGYSWTGWIELHPATAAPLGVSSGDVVELTGATGGVELPAHVTRAVRAGVAAVPVGDATALLDGLGRIGLGARVTARRTGARRPVHTPEEGRSQHGHPVARSVSREAPQLPPRHHIGTMYPPIEHPEHRWGLTIDLDRCTGCGACTAACYVENNLAIVGAEDVAMGRSMSWLKVQAYVDQRPEQETPQASFLPLGCQHCTNAPCEAVCPTFATYHSKEGLNTQVYPRCVGTRYCENNCPYGVRRFNFFDWPRPARAGLGLNPDVTVRERGVTEKCSLCVHRIHEGEERAKLEDRKVRDGEIVSACAATCPTRAITFGDLKDPGSAISRIAASGRAYKLLEELNTEPGVVYLARRRDKA